MGRIKELHLRQLEDYIPERNHLAHKYVESNDDKWIDSIVGNSIDPILENKIKNGYLFQNSIPAAALTMDHYWSDDGQFQVLTDTHLKNVCWSYDETKYQFKPDIFGKSRLVWDLVRQYVEDHPEKIYSELKKSFS